MYWRCPKCGGPTVMEMVCGKCLEKEKAPVVGATETKGKNISPNICPNYTTKKGVLSSV